MNTVVRVVVWALIGLAVLFGIGMLFFKTRVAPDDSMAPNILAGDKYLLCYRCDIEKGDPVLCSHPDPSRKGVMIMGRVIAMEGDTVEVRRGEIRVNGAPKAVRSEGKPYEYFGRTDRRVKHLFQLWRHTSLYGEQVPVLYARERRDQVQSGFNFPDRALDKPVARGHLFLMGDNRLLNLSWDDGGHAVVGGGCNSSFCYGQVPVANCQGVVYFIYSAAERGGEGKASARRLSFVP